MPDFTGRSFDRPPQPISVFAYLQSFLIVLGGGHPATVRAACPPREALDFVIYGLVLLGSMVLTASTVTTVLYFAIGEGRFSPLHILVGLVIALVQGMIDNLFNYRRPIYKRGCAELRRADTRLPEVYEGGGAIVAARSVRGGQGAAIGGLAGVSLVLAAMGPSIQAYQTRTYLADTPTLAASATRRVDAAIARGTDEYNAAKSRVDRLDQMSSALRQEDVRRALRAGRRTSESMATSESAIQKLEGNLTAETANRDRLREALDKLVAGRNAAIERDIATDPTATPRRSGLSGQLEAVSALTKNDPKLLIFVAAFVLISFALELGPMWISMVYFPSIYAAHVAMQHFIEVTRIGEEGSRKLGPSSSKPIDPPRPDAPPLVPGAAEPAPKQEPPQTNLNLNGATPSRRGPGRPRNADRIISKETEQ